MTAAGVGDANELKVESAHFFGGKDLELGALVRELSPEGGIVAIAKDAKSSAVGELFFRPHLSRLGSVVSLSASEGVGPGMFSESALPKAQSHLAGSLARAGLCRAANRASVAIGDAGDRPGGYHGEKSCLGGAPAHGRVPWSGISNIIETVGPSSIIIGSQITGA